MNHLGKYMDKLMCFGDKMMSNRYLSSICDAFVAILPLTMAASLAILFNNVILAGNLPFGLTNPEYWGESVIAYTSKMKYIFTSIEYGGLKFMALLFTASVAYALSKKEGAENPFTNACIILGIYLALMPKGVLLEGGMFESVWDEGYTLAVNAGKGTSAISSLFGGENLFTAMFVSILGTSFLLWLQKLDKLKIKMPDSVPTAVARSFSVMIPSLILFLCAGIVAFVIKDIMPFGFSDISSLISGLIQQPFISLGQSGLGGASLMIIYTLFSNLLWIFGLHGPMILGGFSAPTLDVLGLQNMITYAQTGNAFDPNLATFTSYFGNAYTLNGGSGSTIALILAIFLFSKRSEHKAMAKFSLVPGLFNINEPLIFGLPIILNPILGIPFVLAPLAGIVVPGLLTYFGIIPKIVLTVPWVAPPVIYAFLGTGGNFLAAFVSLINIFIMTAIYIPFVIIANRQGEDNENSINPIGALNHE